MTFFQRPDFATIYHNSSNAIEKIFEFKQDSERQIMSNLCMQLQAIED